MRQGKGSKLATPHRCLSRIVESPAKVRGEAVNSADSVFWCDDLPAARRRIEGTFSDLRSDPPDSGPILPRLSNPVSRSRPTCFPVRVGPCCDFLSLRYELGEYLSRIIALDA